MIPAVSSAQDFGVMNSAETINRGNFKLMVNPIVVFGENGADNDVGIAVAAGYGFTDRFDMEGKAAFFDGLTSFGADAEYAFVSGDVDVSGIGGFHFSQGDGDFGLKAIDATFLVSGHVQPRFEIFGALDVAHHAINDANADFTTVHIVPGIEYAISSRFDFVAEVGIGANEDAANYVSAGIAVYFQER
jgi:hypothetical protein